MKELIKLIVISLALMAAVVGTLVWFNNKKQQSGSAIVAGVFGGSLTVKENDYDFGSIKINGGLTSHEYILENSSGDTVKINEVSTSCMCTEVELKIDNKTYGPFGMPGHLGGNKTDVIVKPGQKIIVKAVFDAAAHGPSGIGEVMRQIFINTGNVEPLILTFKANVTP